MSYEKAAQEHREMIAAIQRGIEKTSVAKEAVYLGGKSSGEATPDDALQIKIALSEAGFKIVRDKR